MLRADGHHLAARIHKLIRVVRQLVEVQPILCELSLIERPPARLNLSKLPAVWQKVAGFEPIPIKKIGPGPDR